MRACFGFQRCFCSAAWVEVRLWVDSVDCPIPRTTAFSSGRPHGGSIGHRKLEAHPSLNHTSCCRRFLARLAILRTSISSRSR